MVLVSDEKTGSLYGVDYVLAARSELFGPADLIVMPVVDRSDSNLLEVAEKSIFWLRVEVRGRRQVHISAHHCGLNTMTAVARMMVTIHELKVNFFECNQYVTLLAINIVPTRYEAGVENINTIPGR